MVTKKTLEERRDQDQSLSKKFSIKSLAQHFLFFFPCFDVPSYSAKEKKSLPFNSCLFQFYRALPELVNNLSGNTSKSQQNKGVE